MNEMVSDYLVEYQFKLPSKLYPYASRYNKVTWEQAIHLYEIAVESVLTISGEQSIYTGRLSYGRGMTAAKQEFLSLMDKAQKFAEYLILYRCRCR